MNSGLSKWSNETKHPAKSTVYIESKPLLCDCGGSTPIGGDAGATASFFYTENFEWQCSSCGRILEPTSREYEEL